MNRSPTVRRAFLLLKSPEGDDFDWKVPLPVPDPRTMPDRQGAIIRRHRNDVGRPRRVAGGTQGKRTNANQTKIV